MFTSMIWEVIKNVKSFKAFIAICMHIAKQCFYVKDQV